MVMDRRILCVGVAVLASSLLLLTGVASARGTTSAAPTVPPGTCEVTSLPSFVAQGEFASAATVGDVIEVSCNPYNYSNGAEVELTAAQLYSRCGNNLTWYLPATTGSDDPPPNSRSIRLKLDQDGNANVGLIAGPHCMAGGSLITVDELESPYETYVTEYKVLPAVNTEEGLFITPKSQVENQETSSVVTIAQAEFSNASEKHVRIGAGQLFNRCKYGDRLEIVAGSRKEFEDSPEALNAIELDNNGNGFVLLLGEESCAEGPSLIEADLESSPFTTIPGPSTAGHPGGNPIFTIESPRPRVK
jgi:hypothetical protein